MNQKKPKISILLANYNNGRYFEEAMRSLKAQTEPCWEAIVIEDASTDDSAEIIQDCIKEDPRFKFFRNEQNLGYQRSIVRAISLSSADIFGRLDPDDTLSPDAIEVSLAAHKAYPEVGLVYSDLLVCTSEMVPWFTHYGKQVEGFDENYLNIYGEVCPFATFKKSVYNKTTGIDTFNRRAEDKDIYLKMCEAAPVKYIPKELYQYRIHSGGISSANVDRAFYWHWVALIKMAQRRNVNLEDHFTKLTVNKEEVNFYKRKAERLRNAIQKNFFLKLIFHGGHHLGFYRIGDYM